MSDPILRIENLTKEFGKLIAVDDATPGVERGEFRGFIGPNGAGKTTTFDLLAGALRPTRGTVTLNGEDMTALPPHERVRRGLGWSFRITNVFSGPMVRENVRLATQAAREGGFTSVEAYLRRSDAFDDVNKHTDRVLDRSGLLGRGNEPADMLAYGDKRRLGIAVVLAIGPGMVLPGEPAADMSAEGTRATMGLVDEALSDRTLLPIKHNIDLVMRVSDRATALHRGEVLTEGTPAAISEDPEVREAHFGGVET